MPFLLTIKAKGNQWSGRGSATSKHKTLADAETALHDYVLNNWDNETDGELQPSDAGVIVHQYFESFDEQYEIIKY